MSGMGQDQKRTQGEKSFLHRISSTSQNFLGRTGAAWLFRNSGDLYDPKSGVQETPGAGTAVAPFWR
jgi:hypothetical protein